MTPDHQKNTPLCAPRGSRWRMNSWICARGIFRTVHLRGYSFCCANSRYTLNTDVCQCNQCHTHHTGIDCQMSPSRNRVSLYDGSSRIELARISHSQKSDETPTPSHIFWTCLILYYTSRVFL